MSEYLAPGVYIEEIDIGSRPIEGVSTSTAGFLGLTERGPITPQLVTSFNEYQRIFGGYIKNSYLTYGVEGFFANGGSRCFVGRIVGEGALTASLVLTDTGTDTGNKIITVKAIGPGKWGNCIAVEVKHASLDSTGSKKLFQLEISYWKDKIPDANPAKNLPADIIETYDNLSIDPISSDYYEKRINGISTLIKLEHFADGVPASMPANEQNNKLYILINGTDGLPAASWILTKGSTGVIEVKAKKVGAAGNNIAIVVENATDTTLTDAFNLTVKNESYQNVYENLTTVDTVNSDLNSIVTLTRLAAGRPDNASHNLEGGMDEIPKTAKNFNGSRTGKDGPTGLAGFEEIEEISILCVPDENDNLRGSMVIHCENMKDRFAILQAPQSAGPVSDLWPRLDSSNPQSQLDSRCAAFYYPWISVLDPVLNTYKLVPPGGHVAGVYSRTDQERGVHKAPANEVVRGANSLQFNITKGEQDILNPRGVNCIRSFPGRGIRIWGARTTSSDPKWKYVNVRRLFLYLEESIEDGTQWVVFEPNNEKLWAKVRQTVEEFLTRIWREGALMGTTRDEAFFVRCDRTTMTQDDINNGRLVILVGVAPVKPAEFVIFRIAQVAKGSEIAEA